MGQNNLWLNFRKYASTTLSAAQLDPQLNLGVVQAHGNKHYASYGKNIFVAANQAGVTTSAGLATTYVGICLSNPAASTKILSVRSVSGALIVAPSTITTIALAIGYTAGGVTAHTTPITALQPSFVGNSTVPQGLVDSACTLVGTPVYARILAQCGTATTSTSFVVDLDGSYIIPPGGWIATVTNIAGPTSGFLGAFEWEEVAP